MTPTHLGPSSDVASPLSQLTIDTSSMGDEGRYPGDFRALSDNEWSENDFGSVLSGTFTPSGRSSSQIRRLQDHGYDTHNGFSAPAGL